MERNSSGAQIGARVVEGREVNDGSGALFLAIIANAHHSGWLTAVVHLPAEGKQARRASIMTPLLGGASSQLQDSKGQHIVTVILTRRGPRRRDAVKAGEAACEAGRLYASTAMAARAVARL